MDRQGVHIWVVIVRPQVSGQNIRRTQGYSDLRVIGSEPARAFLKGTRKMELTAVKRKKRASTVNMKGVVSHDEMRRIEKKAIATGMETTNSTSMTRRGLGSRGERPTTLAESGRDPMTDPAAWNAVDRRETKIEPAPPGRPK